MIHGRPPLWATPCDFVLRLLIGVARFSGRERPTQGTATVPLPPRLASGKYSGFFR
jgi:hypothetical protein